VVVRGLLITVIVFSWYSAWTWTAGHESFSLMLFADNDLTSMQAMTVTEVVQKTTGNNESNVHEASLSENSSLPSRIRHWGNSATVSDTTTIKDTDSYNQTTTNKPPITILIQLAGEMGNNLGKIAYGICLQEYLREDFDTPSEIVLRHQERPKWRAAYQNLVKCFPWTRQFDFSTGNTPSFREFLESQPAQTVPWWKTMEEANLGRNAEKRHAALQYVVDLWGNNSDPSTIDTTGTLNITLANGARLTNPFLYATAHGSRQPCYDRFYDTIRERLNFDSDACCSQLPLANESVFVSLNGTDLVYSRLLVLFLYSHVLCRRITAFSKFFGGNAASRKETRLRRIKSIRYSYQIIETSRSEERSSCYSCGERRDDGGTFVHGGTGETQYIFSYCFQSS
jgi:hypothetical protein